MLSGSPNTGEEKGVSPRRAGVEREEGEVKEELSNPLLPLPKGGV